MKHVVGIVASLCVLAPNSEAEKAVVVQQVGSPLEIVSYTAQYVEGGTYANEGIRHAVTVKNVGQQNVHAYEISLRSFDAFNEDMGLGLGGISMEVLGVDGSRLGTWVQNPYASFKFDKYGTGVAYVSRVRLEDGTIWSADQAFVLGELQKIQDDLTADIFENKEQ